MWCQLFTGGGVVLASGVGPHAHAISWLACRPSDTDCNAAGFHRQTTYWSLPVVDRRLAHTEIVCVWLLAGSAVVPAVPYPPPRLMAEASVNFSGGRLPAPAAQATALVIRASLALLGLACPAAPSPSAPLQ